MRWMRRAISPRLAIRRDVMGVIVWEVEAEDGVVVESGLRGRGEKGRRFFAIDLMVAGAVVEVN